MVSTRIAPDTFIVKALQPRMTDSELLGCCSRWGHWGIEAINERLL